MYRPFARRGAAAGLALALGWAPMAARAETWSVITLGSGVPGLNYANAITPAGGFQVGASEDDAGISTAYVWQGTAASATNVTPAGYEGAGIESVSYAGGKPVFGGFVVTPGNQASHAAFWTPGAGPVDLHPAISSGSSLLGMSADAKTQVGSFTAPNALGNDASHAGLWRGTAESLVDLTPAAGIESNGYAISGNGAVQGGSVDNGGADLLPGIWNGSAESFVDLTPNDALGGEVYALNGDGSIQAGYADFDSPDGPDERAGYWNGSASSFTLLNPPNWDFSNVTAVTKDGQTFVGFGYDNTVTAAETHALLWTADGGSAGYLDLHQYVPAEFSDSAAYGVTQINGVTYIVGEVFRPDGSEAAALWRRTADAAPEPGTLLLALFGGAGIALIRRRRA